MNLLLALAGALASFTIAGLNLQDAHYLASFVWLASGGIWTATCLREFGVI